MTYTADYKYIYRVNTLIGNSEIGYHSPLASITNPATQSNTSPNRPIKTVLQVVDESIGSVTLISNSNLRISQQYELGVFYPDSNDVLSRILYLGKASNEALFVAANDGSYVISGKPMRGIYNFSDKGDYSYDPYIEWVSDSKLIPESGFLFLGMSRITSDLATILPAQG